MSGDVIDEKILCTNLHAVSITTQILVYWPKATFWKRLLVQHFTWAIKKIYLLTKLTKCVPHVTASADVWCEWEVTYGIYTELTSKPTVSIIIVTWISCCQDGSATFTVCSRTQSLFNITVFLYPGSTCGLSHMHGLLTKTCGLHTDQISKDIFNH